MKLKTTFVRNLVIALFALFVWVICVIITKEYKTSIPFGIAAYLFCVILYDLADIASGKVIEEKE